jgi:hypothetical protein
MTDSFGPPATEVAHIDLFNPIESRDSRYPAQQGASLPLAFAAEYHYRWADMKAKVLRKHESLRVVAAIALFSAWEGVGFAREERSGGRREPTQLKELAFSTGIRRDRPRTTLGPEEARVVRTVKQIILDYSHFRGEALGAKEAIAAMAAVVGERCIEAAGEYTARGHKFVPGQRVFSDLINTLLAGEVTSDDLAAVPGNSVFGIIRDQLEEDGFKASIFPSIPGVFRGFAAQIGHPDDWGKVPLSLPRTQWPQKLPLRVTFDTRAHIDAAVGADSGKKLHALRMTTLALTTLMKELRAHIDPNVSLIVALETINGMAKTAPMTDKAIENPSEAMLQAQHNVVKIEHRSPAQAKMLDAE